MPDSAQVERRRQFCQRCGQLMFEYFRSSDGHFGLVDVAEEAVNLSRRDQREVHCPACGARYRLLDRLSAMGQPVERQ